MRPPPKLLVAVAVAAATLLPACKRDVELPAPSAAPRVASFSPVAGYAGQRLVVAGAGFDSDPQGNLVQFARASARAESVSAAGLVVRVPADAGDGPFTVTTKRGVSAPSGAAFTYLGRGELGANAITSELQMLHKPYRVLPARDETFLHSDLLLGIVRYGDPAFVDARAVAMDQARWTSPDPSIVWLDSDSAAVSTLVRQTVAATGAVTTAATAGIPYAGAGRIVAMRAAGGRPDAVAVLRNTGAGYTVALHRLDTFAAVSAGALPIAGVADLRGCVDAGGDLACLGRAASGDPLTVLRVRFGPASPPITSATAAFAPAPPGVVVESRFLPDDPLCADATTHRAVVALADGRLASTDVSLVSPTFVTTATPSRTSARSLTCVPGATGYGTDTGPTVLVSKLGDDLLTRLDPVTGQIRWSVPVSSASAAGLWCPDAACASGTVHAAGEADNGVLLLDLATGALLGRRSFDVAAGRVDAPDALLDRTGNQGAAWYQANGAPPTLAFLTTAPPGIVEWPLTAQRGSGLYPHFRDRGDAVAVVPWSDALGYATVRRSRFVTEAWEPALAGSAVLAVDNGDHISFGTTAGLETVSWDTGLAAVAGFAPADWMSMQRRADGAVLAAVADSTGWFAAGWSEAEAARGDLPPSLLWSSPGGLVVAAVRLQDQDWAFYWDGSWKLHAVALTGAFQTGADQQLADPFYSVIAVSPNGQTFVSWDFQPFSRDTSVVVWSVDATGVFSRRATIPVAGQVSGAAFDGTGEKLYVVTRGPDRILVLE